MENYVLTATYPLMHDHHIYNQVKVPKVPTTMFWNHFKYRIENKTNEKL